MAIWQSNDKSIFCEVSKDGSISFMKKGSLPLTPSVLSLKVHESEKSNLLCVLKHTLRFFNNGYSQPITLSSKNVCTTVVDWNRCIFTLATKQYKDGVKIHWLDIGSLVTALRDTKI